MVQRAGEKNEKGCSLQGKSGAEERENQPSAGRDGKYRRKDHFKKVRHVDGIRELGRACTLEYAMTRDRLEEWYAGCKVGK